MDGVRSLAMEIRVVAVKAFTLFRAFVAGSMVASIAFELWGSQLLPASIDQMTASALAGLGLVGLKAIVAAAA